MKLERYLLFTDGMIYKYNPESDLYHYMGNDKKSFHGSLVATTQVKKTSSNILDLVEVGDLVKWGSGLIESLNMLNLKDLYNYSNMVVAFYKKQPNGDYKRYEVER